MTTCSSPGCSVTACGSAAATCWPPFQVFTVWASDAVTAAEPQFFTLVCTTISPAAMRGATWIVSISGLSQKISDTLS